MVGLKDLKRSWHERLEREKNKDIENFLHNFEDVDLRPIITEFQKLTESGVYNRLFDIYKLGKRIIAPGVRLSDEEQEIRTFTKLANENLSNPPINLSTLPFNLRPITDLIHIWHFKAMYEILEYIYCMHSGRPLDHEDARNLYLSGLGESIVFALDNFNEVSKTPEISLKFFKKLSYVQWQDKKPRKIFENLTKIRAELAYGLSRSYSLMGFGVVEDNFLMLLAGCSAVNSGRDKINEKDVIRAYRTYFKLLKTDITNFKAKIESKSSNGYLVCEKCNKYYKLQPGESPDDFTSECECGGKLKFYENIDWLLDGGEDVEKAD